MDSPAKLLKEAHRSLFSEGDAIRAQQLLDRILNEYPESPQAKRARELQEMLGSAPTPSEPYSRSKPDNGDGFVIAFFRVLAALIGIGSIVAVVAEGTSIELTWPTIVKGSLHLAVGLAFLDIGLSGGRFFFAPVMLAINRIVIGKFRYILYGLALGIFVSAVILVAIGDGEKLLSDTKRFFSGDLMEYVWLELGRIALGGLVVLFIYLFSYLFPPRK
jgi:hypothetical protein